MAASKDRTLAVFMLRYHGLTSGVAVINVGACDKGEIEREACANEHCMRREVRVLCCAPQQLAAAPQ